MLPLPIGVPIACKEGILIWWLKPPDSRGSTELGSKGRRLPVGDSLSVSYTKTGVGLVRALDRKIWDPKALSVKLLLIFSYFIILYASFFHQKKKYSYFYITLFTFYITLFTLIIIQIKKLLQNKIYFTFFYHFFIFFILIIILILIF
jgi:hypothetical protein